MNTNTVTIQLTEKQINYINASFNRMKNQNLNHNPECPYSFTVNSDNVEVSYLEKKNHITVSFKRYV